MFIRGEPLSTHTGSHSARLRKIHGLKCSIVSSVHIVKVKRFFVSSVSNLIVKYNILSTVSTV